MTPVMIPVPKGAAAENSRLRCFAPTTRIAAAVAGAFAFSFVRGLPAAFLCLAVAAALTAAARPAVRALLRRLAGVNGFLALVWLTLPLSLPWAQAAGTALLLTVKCNAVFLVFQALAGGLDAAAISRALAGLGLPAKLVFLVFFTGRHIHAVGEEWARLRTAAALRGFVPGTNLHTYRAAGNILGLTVVRAVERSKRTYEAMILRGFDGRFRTVDGTKPGRKDFYFAATAIVLFAGIIILDAAGGQ